MIIGGLLPDISMQHWGEGYVTDIQYVDEFNPEQSPQNIALAATLRGFEPPDLSGKFAYCELGCGKGLTSLILAAANPNGEFHAIDFNPAYIARAESQMRAAGVTNITFYERSIPDLNAADAPALPMFDIVALHGVWSWVSPDVQAAILEFLKRRVKPGGLVYITYNLMTQWANLLPLQAILRELTSSSRVGRDLAIRDAFATIERLTDAKIIPASQRNLVQQLKRGVPERYLWAYLAHEFLPEHWKPTAHADVARALGLAKLKFAGSADLLRNLSNVYLSDAQLAALAEIPAHEVRETMADWSAGHWLRFDVFVRGARRMSQSRQDALLGEIKLALVRPAPDAIEIPGPNGSVIRAQPEKYRRFTTALAERPRTVAELLALPVPSGYGAVGAAELVCVLLGAGIALPYSDAEPQARVACERLNRTIEAESGSSHSRHTTMAVAPLRTGLTLNADDFELCLALRKGERLDSATLAARLKARWGGNGAHAPETDAEFARKIERLTPLWRKAGVIDAQPVAGP